MQEMALFDDSTIAALYHEATDAERHGDMEIAYRIYERIIATALNDDANVARERIGELRPYRISKFIQKAGDAHRRGAWQEEIDRWRDLLRLRPSEREVAGINFSLRGSIIRQSLEQLKQSARGIAPTNSPDEMIAERIRIAEQNRQFSDLYRNAQEQISNQNLAAAKTLLVQLQENAPYYGDPAGIAKVAGFRQKIQNYEQATKRRTVLDMSLLLFNYTILMFSSIYILYPLMPHILDKMSFISSSDISGLSPLSTLEIVTIFCSGIGLIWSLILGILLLCFFNIPVSIASVTAVFVKDVEDIRLGTGVARKKALMTGLGILSLIVMIIISLYYILYTKNYENTAIIILFMTLLSVAIYAAIRRRRLSQVFHILQPATNIGAYIFEFIFSMMAVLFAKTILGLLSSNFYVLLVIKTIRNLYLPAILPILPEFSSFNGFLLFLFLWTVFLHEPIGLIIRPRQLAMRLTNFGLSILEKEPVAKLSEDLRELVASSLLTIRRKLLITKLPTRSLSLTYLSIASTAIFLLCIVGSIPQTYVLFSFLMIGTILANVLL